MVFVEGRGFRMGLALGQARENDKRRQQYDEDRLRAISEHLADRQFQLDEREKKLADEETLRQANKVNLAGLDPIEKEALAEAPGALPAGAQGPVSPEVDKLQGFFDNVRDVAGRFKNPELAQIWIQEKKAEAQQMVVAREKKMLAETLQNKVADGGFNFTGETEMSPDVEGQLEVIMQALDDENSNPVEIAAMAEKLAAAVRSENQRRLSRQDMSAELASEIEQVRVSGNWGLLRDMRVLQTLWEGGDMTPEQLATARRALLRPHEVAAERAAELARTEKLQQERDALKMEVEQQKAALELREKAIEWWVNENTDKNGNPPKGRPTMPQLREIERMFTEQGGAEKAARPGSTSAPGPVGKPQDAAELVKRGESAQGKGAAQAERGVGDIGPETAPSEKPDTTKKAKAWDKLPANEAKDAEARLLAMAAKGASLKDIDRLLSTLGIDPKSVPQALGKKLVEATKKGGGPTMGETLGRLRPGAGGM